MNALVAQAREARTLSDLRFGLLAVLIFGLCGLVAYHNSFEGVFLLDDVNAILENPSIRNLWAIGEVLRPQEGGGTVCGRPLLNLSFAVNYALGGSSVWGYHAGNLAIHILAALALFAFLVPTLRQPLLQRHFGEAARPLALWISLLWVLHPLQTQSVTYIAQRAESLAGLFYLLTLCAFVRALKGGIFGRRWMTLAVCFSAAAMASKETAVSLPVVALFYDRTFVAGTFREAWCRRRPAYLALASTWLILAGCMLATGDRGGTAGLGIGMSGLAYLQTQGCAILEYLRLSFWPSPLIFDYGTGLVTDPRTFLLPCLLLAVLFAVSLLALIRGQWLGFFGCWFFALLASSSSFIPVLTQTMALHRMYLSLGIVLTLSVLGLYRLAGRKTYLLCAAAAAAFGALTISRNEDFHSEEVLWADTVLKCPANSRALGNLGVLLVAKREFSQALLLLEEARSLEPNDPKIRGNLGIALHALDRRQEAIQEFRAALARDATDSNLLANLGMALLGEGQEDEAREFFTAALRQDPSNPRALAGLQNPGKAADSPPAR